MLVMARLGETDVFLHLGEETVIYDDDIIGIFDIENTSVSKHTKAFLADKKREFITVSYEMPKSFIVCEDNKNEKVYISQISVSTLKKRAGKI